MTDFIPIQMPKSNVPGYFTVQTDGGILRERREMLGLTQQQVADKSGIQLRQYQRFETNERELSGASMRIGLSICSVLKINPYEIMPNTVRGTIK